MNPPSWAPRRAAWALCLCAGTALGQSCPADAPSLPGLPKAFDAWEARNGSKLAAPLRQSLTAEVCGAAADLVKRQLAAPPAIDAVLARTVATYLDLQFQASQPARTVASLLRAEFNVGGGFAKPQMRQLVRVNFKYVKEPERIEVDGSDYARPAALVFLAGGQPLKIRGLAKGSKEPLCQQTLALVVGQPAEFTCQ